MRASPRWVARAAIAAIAAGGLLGLASTAPATPTEAPANLQVVEATVTTIKLTWDPPATPYPDVEVSVVGPLPGGGERTGSTWIPSVGEATVEDLVCGTSYVIRIAFSDGPGTLSGPFATLSAETAPCTKPPPDPPANLELLSVAANKLVFGWDTPASDIDAVHPALFGPGRSGGKASPVATSYSSPVLVCDETYTFNVLFVNDEGRSSAPAELAARTGACSQLGDAPAPPANLRGTDVSLASLKYEWALSIPAESVWMTRLTFPTEGTVYLEGPFIVYSRSNLSCGTAYPIVVAWVDTSGRVSVPAAAERSTDACPVPPAPPVPEQAVLGAQQRGAVAPARKKPVLTLTRKMRVSRFRLGRLRLRCRTTRPRCAGQLKMTRAKRKVRRTRLPVSFGKKNYRAGTRTIKLHVRVPKAAFRKLKKLRKITVFATVTARDRAGSTARKRFRVVLVAPKKPRKRANR